MLCFMSDIFCRNYIYIYIYIHIYIYIYIYLFLISFIFSPADMAGGLVGRPASQPPAGDMYLYK